ncbi:MAG: hypothetical protein ACKOXB_05655 [Flavobacteriales bacterium]
MKGKILLTIGLLVLTTIFSCTKEASIEIALDGERWKIESVTTSYTNHRNTYMPPADFYYFDKEGRGGFYYSNNDSDPIVWSVNDDKITITKRNKSLTYTVLAGGFARQTWQRQYYSWDNQVTEVYELRKE